MNRDEKKAFWRFFLTYFISVALLILASGYFYFSQMQQQLLESEHFSMIKFAKQIKMGEDIDEMGEYTYEIINRRFNDFSIDNFVRNEDVFEKWVPAKRRMGYIFITKEADEYDDKIKDLFYRLFTIELFLLAVFAILSFFLARNALSPLRENIQKLDRFAKDLIHDLNTPVTSIGLNLKVLYKDPNIKDHRALKRLQKSVNDIYDLHTNLSFLLKGTEYELENIDLKDLVESVVQEYSNLYPSLTFVTKEIDGNVLSNSLALKQVLDNLLSNACKYSNENGKITFIYKNKVLEIVDDGIGIKNPERVFERNYTEHNHSSGIGLDIVKRLCDMMNIKVEVESVEKGTLVRLKFD